VRLYFRIATGAFRDRIFTREEGSLPVLLRWTLGVPLLAATAAYVVVPGGWRWMYVELPLAARAAGAAVGVASVCVIALAHHELGRCFSSGLVLRSDHRLVCTGLYRVVRHPMYSAYVALFAAAFLVSESWAVGVFGAAVIVTLMTVRLAREERLLAERFGAEYEAYRRTTGMFLPMTHLLGGGAKRARPGL
jgi:protein-S-isoprenylcysteine O-methyltransferase Ste14